MIPGGPPPEVLICEDDPGIRNALTTATGLFGFHLAGLVDSGIKAMGAVQLAVEKPDMVVFDLALVGDLGLRFVATLLELAPGCAVVVIAAPEFTRLAQVALEAGAMALIDATDLRPFHDSLRSVRNRAHAGSVCPCCQPPTSGTQGGSASVSRGPQGEFGQRSTGSTIDLQPIFRLS
jgi:DNA-binding NarL/FixJ family response regulator